MNDYESNKGIMQIFIARRRTFRRFSHPLFYILGLAVSLSRWHIGIASCALNSRATGRRWILTFLYARIAEPDVSVFNLFPILNLFYFESAAHTSGNMKRNQLI